MQVMETYRVQIQMEVHSGGVDLDLVMAVLGVVEGPLLEGGGVR